MRKIENSETTRPTVKAVDGWKHRLNRLEAELADEGPQAYRRGTFRRWLKGTMRPVRRRAA